MVPRCSFAAVACLLCCVLAAAQAYDIPVPPRQNAFYPTIPPKTPLQVGKKWNVCHRGANNIYPEHTAEAYRKAIELNCDFIETDVLSTKDGKLVVFHDIDLAPITDVAAKFPGRARSLTGIKGGESANATGYFIVDFTLEEVKTLRVNQRFNVTRDKSFNGLFQIPTFEEYIEIALNAPRVVGIYPELKSPVFTNQYVKWDNGKTFEDVFIDTLKKYGYGGKYKSDTWLAKPIFVQSFCPTCLKKMSTLTDMPMVLLLEGFASFTQDEGKSYYEVTSDVYLDYVATFCVGLGPSKSTLAAVNSTTNYLQGPITDLVAKAHVRGMEVHPYTFRNDYNQLAWDYHGDAVNELIFFDKVVGVDGFFTDFGETLYKYLNGNAAVELVGEIRDVVKKLAAF